MPDSKFEEAKRCYKCKQPGVQKSKIRQKRPQGPGMCNVFIFECRNERCKNFEDTWLVQVNDDGSIPTRNKGPKEYPNSDRLTAMGKSYIDQLNAEVDQGETNNPY